MNQRLKIGLVFDDSLDSNDGVQQYVKTLGKWLIRQGHEVRFLVGETKQAGDLQQYVHSLSKNIKISGNQNKMFLPMASSSKVIKQVLEYEQFDILHVMMPFNPIMGSRVIRRAGDVPIIGSFHMVGGTRFINFGAKILALIQRSTLKKVDYFLSVSEAAQQFELEHFGINSDISPNMVDILPFKRGKTRPFLQGKRGTITFLGRLVERKGAMHLLKALNILKNQGKLEGIVVHICGDGNLRAELEDYVKIHQLRANVIFHGYIDEAEKADYLASADIAVFPSTGGEAFGIVLIEAMATGRCVVLGGDNSGYRTVLGGREELLIDPSDHDLLATKLDNLISDSSRRADIIEWQKDEIRAYDVEVVGNQVLDFYYQVIASKNR